MKIKKAALSLFLFILSGNMFLFSQVVSEKKDVAIFPLYSEGYYMPNGLTARIDQAISVAIASFKRFNVIGMQNRMRSADVESFIRKIKESKEAQVEVSTTVLAGEEAFTRADWEKLTGSFLVFVPSISYYDEEIIYEKKQKNGATVIEAYWQITIDGSLTIIDGTGQKGQRVFPLSVQTFKQNKQTAVDNAVESMGIAVRNAIQSEPEFALKSGIIAVDRKRNNVTIQFGHDMGIKPGDEFSIEKPVFIGGLQSSTEVGFFIVTEVHDVFSIGTIVYATQPIVEGDSVKERPRKKLDFQLYTGVTIPVTGTGTTGASNYLPVQPGFGMRFSYALPFHVGFLMGYEYTIQQSIHPVMRSRPLDPFSAGTSYIGITLYNFYASRFKITPELHFCVSAMAVHANPADSSALSAKKTKQEEKWYEKTAYAWHIGGRAILSVEYIMSRRWSLNFSAGVGYMESLTNVRTAGDSLYRKGELAASDLSRIQDYSWNMFYSHLNVYAFLGITQRL